MESFYVVPHLPSTRAPIQDDLRAVFLDAFDHYAEKSEKDKARALLHKSEAMWAFDKLVQRETGEYFHYAACIFLCWKLGDGWLDLFTAAPL